MKWVCTQVHHFDLIEYDNFSESKLTPAYLGLFKHLCDTNDFRTFIKDGKIRYIVGAVTARPGVYELVFLPSRDFVTRATIIELKHMLNWLKHAWIELPDCRRLQALVDVDFPKNARFMEFFGFTREGILKAYGPWGEDMYIFGRVVENPLLH